MKNAQVRWKIFHGKSHFKVKGYDNFKFGNGEAEEELIESSETILDENLYDLKESWQKPLRTL